MDRNDSVSHRDCEVNRGDEKEESKRVESKGECGAADIALRNGSSRHSFKL